LGQNEQTNHDHVKQINFYEREKKTILQIGPGTKSWFWLWSTFPRGWVLLY